MITPPGNPIVAYCDSGSVSLYLVLCTNIICSAFNAPQVAASGAAWPAMVMGATFPTIAYQNPSTWRVRVITCQDPLCTTVNPFVALTDPLTPNPNSGQGLSMTIGSDGLPIIFYYLTSGGGTGLRVHKCADEACTGGTTGWVDSSGINVVSSSATVGVDGKPVVAYRTAAGASFLALCSSLDCQVGTNIRTVVLSGALGSVSVVIGASGMPIVASADGGGTFIYQCKDYVCSTASTYYVDPGPGPSSLAMAMVADGSPTLVYGASPNLVAVHPVRRR